MAKCNKVWEGMGESCFELMMDSAYQEVEVTNSDVIKAAEQLQADYVFPKDYPGHPEETLASLEEFLELKEARKGFNPEVIPIIQPPHTEHYREHEEYYSQFGRFALGGLQAYDSLEQVQIIKEFRQEVGDYVYLHGFGIGTSLPLIKAIRNYSPFLNSFDVSTAEQAIRTGNIPDKTMTRHTFETPYGEDSTTVRAQFSKAVLIMLNYLLSHKINEQTLKETYEEETGLSDIHDAVEATSVRSRHELNFGINMDNLSNGMRDTTLVSF